MTKLPKDTFGPLGLGGTVELPGVPETDTLGLGVVPTSSLDSWRESFAFGGSCAFGESGESFACHSLSLSHVCDLSQSHETAVEQEALLA